ncbi:carboxypeptidase regulatory-like domain-containing protein [Streptomyces bambusae]|uniref:carboxypeptidase regulatory-like domain-containing protein n=1 Tax=Streptomyces bambusae TaxID=1550616 RepID=UPI001CFFF801|nr:carboxypeptidase regulatory-like domain-containing protein [Streptomyces bambusae]MCB5169688.1 carboxypeptidase regulatory-like domain-containing protein [Streptomyces bambusae]
MYGHVRSITGDEPIFMIKVSVYHPDLTLVDHAYTSEDGSYSIAVAAGETVTVRFDTHHSLTNADSWQPSLLTDVVTDDTAPLDRRLVPVGQFADTARGIDVLAAFLQASAVEGPEYAAHAVTRLSQIKQNTLFLQGVQAAVLRHFAEQPGT